MKAPSFNLCRSLAAVFVSAANILASTSAHAAAPLRIETTLVDSHVLHGATFQSNNQKVVCNKRGIFTTHLRTRNDDYTAQQWRLSWSKDGGQTFQTLYEATAATNPPMLETDGADNLYIGHPDWVRMDAVLVRLLSAEDYRVPHVTRAPKGASGKYAMALDEQRKQVCYFSHSGKFIRFGLDGAVKSATLLLKPGGKAAPQYTHLHFTPEGTLHAAWTSLHVPLRRYWGIHHLQSPDGGQTWRTFTRGPLTLPIAADEAGPADRITLDDEFEPSTWLANTLTKDGKTHFLYLAHTKPLRQHHVRMDIATGKREIDHQDASLKGETLALAGLDGFFATDARKAGSPLYCVSHSIRNDNLVCLISRDNGATWHDYAASAKVNHPYAVGGCRSVTADGYIIGSFTEVTVAEPTKLRGGKVWFFKIKAE